MTAKESLQIKGIAILMMLYHHLFSYERVKFNSICSYLLPGGITIESFGALVCKITVTLFLCLGGYGFACKFSDQQIEMKVLLRSALLSVKKIFVKYWISLLIFLPYGFWIGCFSIKDNFISNVLAYKTTYNGECWFIFPYILNILLVLPFLVNEDRKNTSSIKIIFISLTINVCAYIIRFIIARTSFSWLMTTSVYYNVYYLMLTQFPFTLGWVCKKEKIFERIKNIQLGVVQYILLILIVSFIKVYGKGGMLLDSVLTPITILLGVKIIGKASLLDSLLFELGKNSTYMWLTHSYFCFYYFKEYFEKIGNPILMFILLICVSYFSARVLGKIESFFRKIVRSKE